MLWTHAADIFAQNMLYSTEQCKVVNIRLKWKLLKWLRCMERRNLQANTILLARYPVTKIFEKLLSKQLIKFLDDKSGHKRTHVPWCMSGSLTSGGGENVPGIPGACATRNFTYLTRGPLHPVILYGRNHVCPNFHAGSAYLFLVNSLRLCDAYMQCCG